MPVVPIRRTSSHPDSWSAAAEAFLTARGLAAGSRRVYDLTLTRVGDQIGDPSLATLTPDGLASALSQAYPDCSAASWNRHVATLRSFWAFVQRQGWAPQDVTGTLERRREVVDHDKALTRDQVHAILTDKRLSVRDRALFRMLYETAARAQEILNLNVEDLDQPGKRATVVRKGGDRDVVHWQSGTARLLPRLVAGRTRGPLFLSEHAPSPSRAPASTDLDPTTGRARLSYRRAAEVFKDVSDGHTLHSLRHGAITHYAEDGVPLPLLMAKSRHESLKTLQRYARPSVDAVAALTADHDPARRRR